MTKLTSAKMTDASRAIPNPSISNELPIIPSVISSVMALITNRNKPRVKIVTGRVKIMSMGFTKTFNIDKIKLAIIAEPKPDTSNPSKYPAIAKNNTALIIIPMIHLIRLSDPPHSGAQRLREHRQ